MLCNQHHPSTPWAQQLLEFHWGAAQALQCRSNTRVPKEAEIQGRGPRSRSQESSATKWYGALISPFPVIISTVTTVCVEMPGIVLNEQAQGPITILATVAQSSGQALQLSMYEALGGLVAHMAFHAAVATLNTSTWLSDLLKSLLIRNHWNPLYVKWAGQNHLLRTRPAIKALLKKTDRL